MSMPEIASNTKKYCYGNVVVNIMTFFVKQKLPLGGRKILF